MVVDGGAGGDDGAAALGGERDADRRSGAVIEAPSSTAVAAGSGVAPARALTRAAVDGADGDGDVERVELAQRRAR